MIRASGWLNWIDLLPIARFLFLWALWARTQVLHLWGTSRKQISSGSTYRRSVARGGVLLKWNPQQEACVKVRPVGPTKNMLNIRIITIEESAVMRGPAMSCGGPENRMDQKQSIREIIQFHSWNYRFDSLTLLRCYPPPPRNHSEIDGALQQSKPGSSARSPLPSY